MSGHSLAPFLDPASVAVIGASRDPFKVGGSVVANLRSAGFYSEPREDIMRWKYAKLITNLANAVNALCAASPANAESPQPVRVPATRAAP